MHELRTRIFLRDRCGLNPSEPFWPQGEPRQAAGHLRVLRGAEAVLRLSTGRKTSVGRTVDSQDKANFPPEAALRAVLRLDWVLRLLKKSGLLVKLAGSLRPGLKPAFILLA